MQNDLSFLILLISAIGVASVSWRFRLKRNEEIERLKDKYRRNRR